MSNSNVCSRHSFSRSRTLEDIHEDIREHCKYLGWMAVGSELGEEAPALGPIAATAERLLQALREAEDRGEK